MPLCSRLLRAGYICRFLSLLSFIFVSSVLLQCSTFDKSPLQVYNFTLRRFKVFLLHCCRLYWRRFITCFHCVYYYASFLNCVAKVQTYLETTKQKTKNLCLFNVLQQISMVLPKFIHILSTKLAKCAIYKANFFVFRLITYVHYIITNNNAIFVAVCVCRVWQCSLCVDIV